MPLILSAVFLVASASFAVADDLTTNDGLVLKNAAVVKVETAGVVIKHEGGTKLVAWKDLPEPVRQRYLTEALKGKEEEIVKLKHDLARAEVEARKLREVESERKSDVAPVTAVPEQSVKSNAATKQMRATKPSDPVAALPPLNPDEVVNIADLVEQFKIDSASANSRYRKRVLRVRGVIERFDPKLFVRKYHVILASPEKFIRVVCTFDYPNDLKTVYSTERGQKLVGQPADNKQVTLLEAGQTIVVRGKCKGSEGAEITFTGCEVIQ